jgi:hypothetical protein
MTTPIKKFTLKQYNFTESTTQKLHDLMETWDCGTETEAIRRLISTAHKKEFPEYVQAIKARPSAQDRERHKLEAQEARIRAKEESEVERLTDICLSMDEARVEVEDGKSVCVYPMFTGVQAGVEKRWVTVSLDQISNETPLLQYHDILGATGQEGKEATLKRIEERGLIEM